MTFNIGAERPGSEWRIAAWVLAGLSLVLLIGSMAGSGTGMFGTGLLMSWMWLWMLLPFLFLVLVALIIVDRLQKARF